MSQLNFRIGALPLGKLTGSGYCKTVTIDNGDVTVTKKQHRKCQVTCCWHARFSNRQRDEHFYYFAHAPVPMRGGGEICLSPLPQSL